MPRLSHPVEERTVSCTGWATGVLAGVSERKRQGGSQGVLQRDEPLDLIGLYFWILMKSESIHQADPRAH